jgi:hypothetical protein
MSPHEVRWLTVAIALLLAALNAGASASPQESPLEAIRSTTEAVLEALDLEPALRNDPVRRPATSCN